MNNMRNKILMTLALLLTDMVLQASSTRLFRSCMNRMVAIVTNTQFRPLRVLLP